MKKSILNRFFIAFFFSMGVLWLVLAILAIVHYRTIYDPEPLGTALSRIITIFFILYFLLGAISSIVTAYSLLSSFRDSDYSKRIVRKFCIASQIALYVSWAALGIRGYCASLPESTKYLDPISFGVLPSAIICCTACTISGIVLLIKQIHQHRRNT